MTLAELLVWALLSLVVLGIAAVLLWQVLRVTARGSAMGQLQQSGATVMSRLIADLQHTTAKAITLAQDLYGNDLQRYNCAALQTRVKVDEEGHSTYQGVILYCWSHSVPVLRRRSWPGTPTADPDRFTDAQLKNLIDDPQAVETRTPNVTDFLVYSPDVPAPNLGNPLEVTLELRQRAAANLADEAFRLHRSLVLRNSQ